MTEKVTTPKVQAPVIFVNSMELAEKIMKVEAVKAVISGYADLCKELVVDSEATESKALEMLGNLKDVIKKVEDKHTIAKKPYLEGGRFIDGVKKSILGDAEKVITDGKQKIACFREIERKRIEAENLARLAEAEKAVIVADEQKEEHVNDYLTQINAVYILHNEAIERCSMTKNTDELKAWHLEFSNSTSTKFNTKLAPDFADYIKMVFEYMVKLKDLRKNWLSHDSRDAGTWNIVKADAQEVCSKLNQIAIEAIDAQPKLVNDSIELQAAQIEAEVKKPGRWKWEYELEDFSQVPEDWKMLNPDVVAEYISKKKDTLKSGDVFCGVKFIEKEVIVIR